MLPVKNTYRRGCQKHIDLLAARWQLGRQPLLPVFLTESTAKKNTTILKGRFFGTPCRQKYKFLDSNSLIFSCVSCLVQGVVVLSSFPLFLQQQCQPSATLVTLFIGFEPGKSTKTSTSLLLLFAKAKPSEFE